MRVVAGHAEGRQGERCIHTLLERRRAAPSGTCVVRSQGDVLDELMSGPLIVTHVLSLVLLLSQFCQLEIREALALKKPVVLLHGE